MGFFKGLAIGFVIAALISVIFGYFKDAGIYALISIAFSVMG